MKHFILFCLSFITLYSCGSKKVETNTEDLPLDISQKEDWYLYTKNLGEADFEAAKNDLLNNINTLAHSQTCEDINDWMYSGFGLNECGRLAGFIAYPKSVEKEIKKNITLYNSLLTSQYKEQKRNCPPVKRPIGIACENGQVVLKYNEIQEED